MYPQGHKTHVAVFADLLQLLMVLPGRAAGDFRLKAANFLCRLLSGDVTLIPQILQTAANTSREAQAVIMQAVPVPPVDESMVLKRCREENALLDIEERKQRLEINRRESNLAFQVKCVKAINELKPLDDRDKLYFVDLIKMCDAPGYARIEDQQTRCETRGREISIALVAQELGVNTANKNSQIGKLMASRWRAANPQKEFVKRDTMYLGRPYKENVYYQCDYGMLAECIKEVC